MNEAIKVSNLSAGYGKINVIRNISLDVDKGEITAIIGQNGSGKTTLLKAICGLTNASGTCTVFEKNVFSMSEKEKASIIGYISSESSISLEAEVLDVVLMGLYPEISLFKKPSCNKIDDATKILDYFGLSNCIHKNISKLSNGMKHLVMLSRLFIRKLSILIMDEPDSMLDESKKKLLMNKISDCCKSGISALICSHDINLMLRYADKIIVISDGNIIGAFSPKKDKKSEIKGILEKAFPDSDIISSGERLIVI